MGWKLFNDVILRSKSTGAARMLLMVLANHEGKDGIYPAIELLARECNTTERNVTRTLQNLRDMGELVVEKYAGVRTSRGWTNRFVITLPSADDPTDPSPRRTPTG